MDATAVKHELYFGDALRIEFHLSNNCVPVTGATITCTVKRLSDNKYWTGTIWDVITALSLTEYDATNNKGYYYRTPFTPASLADTIVVSIKYNDGTNDLYETHIWAIRDRITQIQAGLALDSTAAKEATLNTKIPTALSFTGANVNAESKVTAAPSDMALNSTVAKDSTVSKAAGTKGTDNIHDDLAALSTSIPTTTWLVKQLKSIMKVLRFTKQGEIKA
jgi:hypothetical protein